MTTYTVSAINKTTANSSFIGTYKTIDEAKKVADSNMIDGCLVHVLESDGILHCAADCEHEKSWSRKMTTEELCYFGDSVYTAR